MGLMDLVFYGMDACKCNYCATIIDCHNHVDNLQEHLVIQNRTLENFLLFLFEGMNKDCIKYGATINLRENLIKKLIILQVNIDNHCNELLEYSLQFMDRYKYDVFYDYLFDICLDNENLKPISFKIVEDKGNIYQIMKIINKIIDLDILRIFENRYIEIEKLSDIEIEKCILLFKNNGLKNLNYKSKYSFYVENPKLYTELLKHKIVNEQFLVFLINEKFACTEYSGFSFLSNFFNNYRPSITNGSMMKCLIDNYEKYMKEKTDSYGHLKNITKQLSQQVNMTQYLKLSKQINLKLWPRANIHSYAMNPTHQLRYVIKDMKALINNESEYFSFNNYYKRNVADYIKLRNTMKSIIEEYEEYKKQVLQDMNFHFGSDVSYHILNFVFLDSSTIDSS